MLLSRAQPLEDIVKLIRPVDRLAVPLATGQPMAFLNALGTRDDWERLEIFTGLLTFPYPWLTHRNVHVTSGYYGPLERMLNEQGTHVDYLPSDFTGFEIFARKQPYRVIAATLSPPDADGYLTFGTHAGAIFRTFVEACDHPEQVTIAEVNHTMPVVYGHPDFGDNKIHSDRIGHLFETSQPQSELPALEVSDVEKKIADHVLSLIPDGATLQFGIGGIPNHIASLLATSSLSNFGIHSELVSDGFLKLLEAGKISNRNKGCFEGQSVFTFAFGSRGLYEFLDERNGRNKRQAVCLPVSVVNDPHIIAKNQNMLSINSGLMVDFAGQVCSEAIGLRQYSGVGGQLSFVQGAYASERGKSILCIKSTAMVAGQMVSNIQPTLPVGSLISTPRHYTQYIVTEHGIADLYGVPDEKRPERLMAVAHPAFRPWLEEEFQKIRKDYYRDTSSGRT